MIEVYAERTRIVREEILKNTQILETMNDIITSAYSNIDEYAKWSHPRHIGAGDHHNIYYLGMITHPEQPLLRKFQITRKFSKEKELHLALRLRRGRPYEFELDPDGMYREIGLFDAAFDQRKNPPYFTGIVTWNEGEHCGIITEDITENHKYRLAKDPKAGSEFIRRNKESYSELFYIDPSWGSPTNGKQYFSKEYRIDLK